MMELLQKFVQVKLIYKLSAFVFALGIIPLLVLFYGLEKKPSWADNEGVKYLENNIVISVHIPLEIWDKKQNEKKLKQKAQRLLHKEIEKKVLDQVTLSYDLGSQSINEQEKTLNISKKVLQKIQINSLHVDSFYEDYKELKYWGLFSTKEEEINLELQILYETINKKILEVM